MMRRVMTYGTFDLFHYGHVNLLRRARQHGGHLTVGLSTDEFNSGKGKKSFFSYEERYSILESVKYVDLIVPEKSWDQKFIDIKRYEIDVFVMGDDWHGKFDFLKEHCEVVYLPRTPEVSSSGIKSALQAPRP